MPENKQTNSEPSSEPRGFGEHTRGLAGEYAHEQGWGLDEAERTRQDSAPQDGDGGADYDYGAQDFGDAPVNTAIDHPNTTQNKTATAAPGSNTAGQGKE